MVSTWIELILTGEAGPSQLCEPAQYATGCVDSARSTADCSGFPGGEVK